MAMTSDDPGRLKTQAVASGLASSSIGSGWRNVALYEWKNAAFEECTVEFQEVPALSLLVSGEPVAVNVNGCRLKGKSYPGLLTFFPSHTSMTFRTRGKVSSLGAYLDPSCFDDVVGDDFPNALESKLRFQCGFKDDFLNAAIRNLVQEKIHPQVAGSLYADSIATAMALHLLRKFTSFDEHPISQKMSPKALQTAKELIHESVESGISLETLARAVGLSRAHFAKAFKLSTGTTPHTYLTNLRIARAGNMLCTTGETIAHIAISCGFSSQAHLTEYFRRSMGVTPLKFRQSNLRRC